MFAVRTTLSLLTKNRDVIIVMQGVICPENSRKISSRFSLSAVNFHGS